MLTNTILSIDCGTQSLRAILFSDQGDVLARKNVEYPPYVSPKPGWAEQDAEIYWSALCRACNQLKTQYPQEFSCIVGVGVTTQRNSMVNVDSNGQALRPLITWLDQRKAASLPVISFLSHRILKPLGIELKVLDVPSEAKSNWIRQHQLNIWEKTHKYLQLSGFLNARLTGAFNDSVASQIGHIPFNYKKQRWAKRTEAPGFVIPVEADKLPKLYQPGDTLGTVTKKASEETGLACGLRVIACGSDKGCETLGVGVVDDSMVSLSFGTTATVQTTTTRYIEPIRFLPPYPAPMPGYYNPEIEIFRGFWMISWFKKEFAYKEVVEAAQRGITAEQVLNRHLTLTQPGAMGLVVYPYWSPGMMPQSTKGAIIGFGDVHTKSHIYRAVIEGLGFALLEGRYCMEKRGGFTFKKAAVSGGASQSDEICKIAANIFNLPMVKGMTHETSALGAAIVTAVGLGIHSSFKDAIAAMVKTKTVFEPDSAHVALYQDIYHRVYRRMFKALSPIYETIREITGYPE